MTPTVHTRELLGCQVSIHLGWNSYSGPSLNAAFEECERIEQTYSRFIANNELARVNARLGEWQEISEELAYLISVGMEAKRRSLGAFDLTVKSILEGWGYDAQYRLNEEFQPGHTGLVELDGRRLRLSAEIELGGLGKGYAIDRMAEILADQPSVLIDAGGDMMAWGEASEAEPWKIVFEDPRDLSRAIGELQFERKMGVGASSPARRKWRDRHHLVDPVRGEPARDMLGVFKQAESPLWADIYSTSLLVHRLYRARQSLHSMPVQAMAVAAGGRLIARED